MGGTGVPDAFLEIFLTFISINRNADAIIERTAVKLNEPMLPAAEVCATKARPQIIAVNSSGSVPLAFFISCAS